MPKGTWNFRKTSWRLFMALLALGKWNSRAVHVAALGVACIKYCMHVIQLLSLYLHFSFKISHWFLPLFFWLCILPCSQFRLAHGDFILLKFFICQSFQVLLLTVWFFYSFYLFPIFLCFIWFHISVHISIEIKHSLILLCHPIFENDVS